MRALALLLLAVAVFAEDRASIATVVDRDAFFVGEPVRIRVRIEYDAEFFRDHGVQMFHRTFDLPVQVRAPWLAGLDGAVARAQPAGAVSLVLNGAEARALRAGGAVEIERTFVPTRPGTWTLPAPELRFVYTTRFEEGFLEERRPVDRHDVALEGAARTVTIRPLPPTDLAFGGAVGRFTVSATTPARAVDAGEVFRVVLAIEGDGNLEFFPTPRLDRLERFHVYGMVDDEASPRRTITYDVAALDGGVTGVPSIPFVYFDPRAAEYRTARTKPMPLTVRGAPIVPKQAEPAPPEKPRRAWVWLLALGAAAVVIALVLRRRRAPVLPEDEIAARFEAAVDADPAEALTTLLAARLACPPAAVIGAGLKDRLVRAGAGDDLAQRTAALVERLVAARYGGASEGGASDVRALVDDLTRELTARLGSR